MQGWNRAQCAKFLHVSERTLHNWESGIHAVPFAALKLLRIMNRYELPDPAWRDWVFHGGKLWTPEDYGLNPTDAACWRNLCRRAHNCWGVFLKAISQNPLCRTASYKHIPLATDTFKLSIAPCMGMEISASQVLRVSCRMPLPSAPRTKANGPLLSLIHI